MLQAVQPAPNPSDRNTSSTSPVVDPWECAAFMYHNPYVSSSMTGYQANHQLDESKQALALTFVDYQWAQFQQNCQCISPASQCPQFGLYNYQNQWPAHAFPPNIHTYRGPPPYPQLQMHPGAIYPQDPAYSVPIHPTDAHPYLPVAAAHTTQQLAYRQPHSVALKPKPHDAQSSQHQFGPPQKPLQSRYALWVGGIPADTHVLALRDHFYVPETAADILSVVLMPRSHSGFVNFRTARSCKDAAHRFNNSAMHNAFLRCRCRRPSPETDSSASTCETASSSSTPNSDNTPASATESTFSLQLSDEETSMTSLSSESPTQAVEPLSPVEQDDESLQRPITTEIHTSLHATDSPLEDPQKSCRYFLIKSLTHEELVASVNSGRWATQSQNEVTLNEAYQACDAVYLIFSVNRSGEFFGYARMSSQIKADAAAAAAAPAKKLISTTAAPSATFSSSQSYKTAGKGLIPEGRVVDELYRGKIFWELCDGDWAAPSPATDMANDRPISSFKVDWISVRKLPFWQTKHLQNPWNSNKPVKVGRDGTELETEVGRRLCHLFLSPPARKSASRVIS